MMQIITRHISSLGHAVTMLSRAAVLALTWIVLTSTACMADESTVPESLTWFAKATTVYEKGEYELAIDLYTKSIRLAPSVGAHANRGKCYAALKRFAPALADFNEAVRLSPKHALPYLSRGDCYAAMSDNRNAEADYDKAIELEPFQGYCTSSIVG